MIFESAIKLGHFSDSWKRGNVVPVHKKESKNLVNNYRPISLLPIFGEIFEKVIYNNLFTYLKSNHLLSDNSAVGSGGGSGGLAPPIIF